MLALLYNDIRIKTKSLWPNSQLADVGKLHLQSTAELLTATSSRLHINDFWFKKHIHKNNFRALAILLLHLCEEKENGGFVPTVTSWPTDNYLLSISDSSNSLLWHFSVKFVPSCLDNISNPQLNFQMVIFRRSKHSLWIVKACDMHFHLTHILNWTLSVLQKRKTCLLLDCIFLPPVSVVWAHLSYCDRGVCRVVEGRIPTSPQGGWRLTTKHSGGLPTWKRKNIGCNDLQFFNAQSTSLQTNGGTGTFHWTQDFQHFLIRQFRGQSVISSS